MGHAPFGKAIGLGGQPLEVGSIEFFEQGAAGDPEPSQRALVVELPQQLADRWTEFASDSPLEGGGFEISL